MATRVVPAPLQLLPNALTVARLILIPVFVALMLSAENGHSWAAGIVFGIAGITDQIDGFLARRWHVESEFGRIFDPLADRLMIDAAVILLFVADHMPWAGLVLILGRDLLLLAGYKAITPDGYQLNVNLIGKAATWLLYAGIGLLIVTHRSTDWPYWIFWTGLVLALVAGLVYGLLGSVPTQGETVNFDDLTFTAEKVQGRRISKILITRQQPEGTEQPGE